MNIRFALALLPLAVGCGGCAPLGMPLWSPTPARQPDLYLIPDGYVGWIHIEYGVRGAPALPVQNGFRVHRFPKSGKIRTSSRRPGGWAKDEYYYVSPQGRKRLNFTEDEGKGMIWGGSSSGGELYTGGGNGAPMKKVWTPETSDEFIGTWQQFYHRKQSMPPRSPEAEAFWKSQE